MNVINKQSMTLNHAFYLCKNFRKAFLNKNDKKLFLKKTCQKPYAMIQCIQDFYIDSLSR